MTDISEAILKVNQTIVAEQGFVVNKHYKILAGTLLTRLCW